MSTKTNITSTVPD